VGTIFDPLFGWMAAAGNAQRDHDDAKLQQDLDAVRDAKIRDLKQQQKQLVTQAQLKALTQALQAALLKLHAQDELVARR
jgi:hypothetical protein